MIEDAESKSRPNIDELRLGILALSIPVTPLVAALRGVVNATLLDTLGFKFDLEKRRITRSLWSSGLSRDQVCSLCWIDRPSFRTFCMQLNGADVDCIACNSLCKYGSVQVQVTSDQSF